VPGPETRGFFNEPLDRLTLRRQFLFENLGFSREFDETLEACRFATARHNPLQ
jgi:hypothetical protein